MISKTAGRKEPRSFTPLDLEPNGHDTSSTDASTLSGIPASPDMAAFGSRQPGHWPRRRWLTTLLLVFVVQLGLIVLLSERGAPLKRLGKGKAPLVLMAGSGWAELLALEDPSLFALPHSLGFSGPAWMKAPELPARSFSWSEETRPLEFDARDLGAAFHRFVATNDFNDFQTLTPPEAVLSLPAASSFMAAPASSSFRIEGPLAQRRILAPPRLRTWSHTNLLADTVVQLVVDHDGRPASPGVLLSTSGFPPADNYALEQARALRFNSQDASKPPQLIWGRLVFGWGIVPVPATNSPPTTPGTPP